MKAAVIGGGSWGSAFARYLGSLDMPVNLWLLEPDIKEELERTRENRTFLPGFKFPEAVSFTNDLDEAVDFGDMVFVAVPSDFCRDMYERMSGRFRKGQIIVSLTKGFDKKTLKTMSGLMDEIFDPGQAEAPVVLSGPSFAKEVAAGYPTAVVVASRDMHIARLVRDSISSLTIRAYAGSDVVGIETAGALKNVVAIASGIVDAMEYGLNSRAALITRGLAEITRLGLAMGARKETFSGLAGIGDLVLTCTGELSRNHWVGRELGRGRSLDEILAGMKMVAEGVHTSVLARKLALSLDVEMPIADEIYKILYEGKKPGDVVPDLMSRTLKDE